MSSETDLSRNQGIQNLRNSFLRGFPLPFNVETLQAFGALFQIPHYYRKFSHCKLKMLFYFNLLTRTFTKNSYLCNQLGNALFCVTSGIFAGRAQRDLAKLHELHKIAFPKVLHTRFFLILTKKSFFKR
jgi:hypothetical protein